MAGGGGATTTKNSNQLFFSALKRGFSAVRFLRRTGVSASEIRTRSCTIFRGSHRTQCIRVLRRLFARGVRAPFLKLGPFCHKIFEVRMEVRVQVRTPGGNPIRT